MSLTIKHPEPVDGEIVHSGLTFIDGVAEFPALEAEAREPLLANGFVIEGENDVAETPEDEAARLAAEAEAAEQAAEAERLAAEAKAEEERKAAEAAAAAEAEKAAAAAAAEKAEAEAEKKQAKAAGSK